MKDDGKELERKDNENIRKGVSSKKTRATFFSESEGNEKGVRRKDWGTSEAQPQLFRSCINALQRETNAPLAARTGRRQQLQYKTSGWQVLQTGLGVHGTLVSKYVSRQ
jgi:hypothetical protein